MTIWVRGEPRPPEERRSQHWPPADLAAYIADLGVSQRPRTPERIWRLLGADPFGTPALASLVSIEGNAPSKRVAALLKYPSEKVPKRRAPKPPPRKAFEDLAPSTRKRITRYFSSITTVAWPADEIAGEAAKWHASATPQELRRAMGTEKGHAYVSEAKARARHKTPKQQHRADLIKALRAPIRANHLAFLMIFEDEAVKRHPTLWAKAWRQIARYLTDPDTILRLYVGPS